MGDVIFVATNPYYQVDVVIEQKFLTANTIILRGLLHEGGTWYVRQLATFNNDLVDECKKEIMDDMKNSLLSEFP